MHHILHISYTVYHVRSTLLLSKRGERRCRVVGLRRCTGPGPDFGGLLPGVPAWAGPGPGPRRTSGPEPSPQDQGPAGRPPQSATGCWQAAMQSEWPFPLKFHCVSSFSPSFLLLVILIVLLLLLLLSSSFFFLYPSVALILFVFVFIIASLFLRASYTFFFYS